MTITTEGTPTPDEATTPASPLAAGKTRIWVQAPGWPVTVPRRLIDQDISPETLAAYVYVMAWLDEGSEASSGRLADRMGCTPDRAAELVADLEQLGAVRSSNKPAPRAPVTDLPGSEIPPLARLTHEPNGPDGPDGSWTGVWPPLPGDPFPPRLAPVVYVLFDDQHHPSYVGSTGDFRTRIRAHAREKRDLWSTWVAYPCASRSAAYDVETRFLRQYMPALNVQGPRAQGGVV